METFFRFVSPYALGNPARPDQGFTSSDCSTAIDRREPTLRSHLLLSGNRKANQEPQKVFPPSSPRCSGPVRKIFWLKSPYPLKRQGTLFSGFPLMPRGDWLANKTEKNSAFSSRLGVTKRKGKEKNEGNSKSK